MRLKYPSQMQIMWFAVALALLAIGQALLTLGPDFLRNQQPVDWAHWLILVGAAGAACAIGSMALGAIGRFGRVLMILGAVAFISMAGIDFLLWALPSNATINPIVDEALGKPAIAIPLLQVGPSLFFVGLCMLGIEWWRITRLGAGLIILGTLLSGLGQGAHMRWVVAASFVIILAGLGLIWAKLPALAKRN